MNFVLVIIPEKYNRVQSPISFEFISSYVFVVKDIERASDWSFSNEIKNSIYYTETYLDTDIFCGRIIIVHR